MQHHSWCCSCHCRTTCGVAGTVVAPCMVSWALLSCCVRCHRRCRRAVRDAMGAVVMLQVLLSYRTWCCGRCCHAICGAAGAVVVLHGCCGCHHLATHDVVRAVVLPHLVLQLLASCCVGVAAAGVVLYGCCSCHYRMVCGVAGAVVIWRVVL